jgi:hypothetical protein
MTALNITFPLLTFSIASFIFLKLNSSMIVFIFLFFAKLISSLKFNLFPTALPVIIRFFEIRSIGLKVNSSK